MSRFSSEEETQVHLSLKKDMSPIPSPGQRLCERGHGHQDGHGNRRGWALLLPGWACLPQSPQVIAKANLLSGQATAQEAPSHALTP